MSVELAQEELEIIDRIYCLVESKEIDDSTLLQIDEAANADDIEELKRILERIR